MSAHLTADQIENYLSRRLSRADLDHVHDHLFDCEDCYDQFLDLFEKQKLPIEIDLDELGGLKDWHLEGEDLRAYVEGRMDQLDLDFANMHLEGCEWCKEEVISFSEFNSKLSYYLSKRHRPTKRHSIEGRYIPELRNLSRPLQMAGVSILGLLLLSSTIMVWLFAGTKPAGESAGVSEQAVQTPPLHIEQIPSSANTNSHATEERSAKQVSREDNISSARIKHSPDVNLLAKNPIKPSVIDLFDRSSVVLRGGSSEDEYFNVISPYRTVIGQDKPDFHWSTLSGASSYVVSVYDKDLRLVVTSEPLTVSHWRIPLQLKHGEIYTWIVTAHKDGKEVVAPLLPARAEFMIIAQTDLVSLNRKLKAGSSKLGRGVIYAEAGLLDDAEREIQAHLVMNPTDKSGKQLLRTIKSWRKN